MRKLERKNKFRNDIKQKQKQFIILPSILNEKKQCSKTKGN